ncbi:hypothetical protein ES705_09758 [subsurface metagenome]
MNILLEAGDIFLTRGSSFISRAIRFFTRSIGEKRTKVNHVGLVVQRGKFKTAIAVEALCKVMCHKLWTQYGPPRKDCVAVYRATNLTAEQVKDIVVEAEKQVGKKYGFLMIAAHFKDWLLGRMVGWLFGWQFSDVYLLRRFISGNKYPICSWVVADAFAEVGKDFGVKVGMATPDDIWDFIQNNPDKYKEIHPLKLLSQE